MAAGSSDAKKLMEQAKKTKEKFFSFGKGKYEQAAELYNQAGNLFKAEKHCLHRSSTLSFHFYTAAALPLLTGHSQRGGRRVPGSSRLLRHRGADV